MPAQPLGRIPPASVTVPQAAIELAKRFEGFERRVKRGTEITAIPYVCPAGFWTIGYGHLCAPDHQPITLEEAESYLAQDLVKALNATLRYCPVLATESEGRLAAVLDFTFNLGAGASADIDPSETDQSAGLGCCRAGTAPVGLWRRKSAAGTRYTARGRSKTVSCVAGNCQLRIIAMRPMATTTPMTPDAATAPHVPSFGLSQ